MNWNKKEVYMKKYQLKIWFLLNTTYFFFLLKLFKEIKQLDCKFKLILLLLIKLIKIIIIFIKSFCDIF